MVDKIDIQNICDQLESQSQKRVYNFADSQLKKQRVAIEEDNILYLSDYQKPYEITSGRATAAGSALYVDNSDARKEVLRASMVSKGADELVEMVAQSMESLIHNGEEIYIRYQPTVEQGEIAIVRIDGEDVTCKRVYVDRDTIRLKSEKEDYKDMIYNASEVAVLGMSIPQLFIK